MYSFLILVLLIIVFLALHYRINTITFDGYRPRVSAIYCSLFASNSIPDYPIIFVPGIKGSLLEKDGELVWLTARNTFYSKSTSPLVLHSDDGVATVGVFTRLVSIPVFFEYRGYHRISADLACMSHGYTFHYDWRKAPEDIIPELDALVSRVAQETGKKPAIIAHSYGGVIVRGYSQNEYNRLGPIVYVGTPFDPGPDYLIHDLTKGSSVFFNKTLTTAPVIVSHDSSYYLIPHKGSPLYRERDVMNATTWKEYALGPYAYDPTYSLSRLQERLDRAVAYQQTMRAPFKGTNPVLVVYNNEIRTMHSVLPGGEVEYALGDGRVDGEAAQPSGINKEQITLLERPERHSQQLQTKEALADIYSFISNAVTD
ncbi:MAG: hypothetical protein Q8P93_03380 [bacterium]|nr:hypothetical protein [bacterium]